MKAINYAITVVVLVMACFSASAETITEKEWQRLNARITQLEDRLERLEAQLAPQVSTRTTPCMEESVDTKDSFRSFGVAEEYDQTTASMKAVAAAVEELTKRIFPSYTNEDMQLVSKKCQIVCRQMEIQATGFYKCYVAIAVSKKDVQQ